MNNNIEVSKEQLQFMRTVKSKQEYIYDPSDIDIVMYLCRKGLLIQYTKASSLSYCKLTEDGKAYLYNRKVENRFRYLPIAISIFAAIGGYREEISLIAKAIMKLMKSLMGN